MSYAGHRWTLTCIPVMWSPPLWRYQEEIDGRLFESTAGHPEMARRIVRDLMIDAKVKRTRLAPAPERNPRPLRGVEENAQL